MATPTVRKRQLGNELRHLREEAHFTQEEAGKVVEKPQSKIAALENGQGTITPGDLKLLLDMYGVTDPQMIEFLMELRRNNQQRGRWTGYRSVYPEQFRMFVDLEEDAELLRSVEAEVPPGLLQCERFVRSLYAAREDLTEQQIEDRVQARLHRQRILHRDNPTHAAFVISESSLSRRYGGTEVMREQIDHMIRMSKLPHIQLQVLPFDVEANVSAEIGFRFVLFRIPSPGTAGPLEFAYVEGADDNRYLDDKRAVAAHDRLWSRLSAAALSPAASRTFMQEAAKRYHG